MSVSVLTTDVPALSASSSTASSSASSVSSIPARRIRFAPLPDPRALDDNVDDDTTDHEDSIHTAVSTSLPDSKPCSLSSSPSSDAFDHPPTSPKPTTQQLLSHPPIPHAPSWSRPKSLNLLRPFPFRKSSTTSSAASSHSLTPTPSLDSASSPTPTNVTSPPSSFSRKNFSTEEILTLGTINLFRTSSKNKHTSPNTDASSGWGFGLTRWSSASSDTKSGTPLARSQSAQSYTPSISSKLKLGSLKSSKDDKAKLRSSSVTSTQSAPSSTAPAAKRSSLPTGRKGTRMLNGRVYGAPKRQRDPNANPFANARDEDPEFVEWGYGGMGSVRGGRHAGVTGKDGTRWERLQSDATFMGASSERKGVGDADVEQDDGSGMGWVRKRKEQRERERKEREEKEKAEKEQAEAKAAPTPVEEPVTETVDADTSAAPAAPVETHPESPPSQPALEPLSISVPPIADDLPSSSMPAPTPVAASFSAPAPTLEHNLTAVTLPANLSRHHSYSSGHRRIGSRTTSAEAIPVTPASAPLPNREEVSSESETESESEKHADDEDDEDDDEEEEEEEEENHETERKRKTALGAGVEKISRHN